MPLTAPAHLPRTLGALRASENGAPHSVKAEIRANLLAALGAGADPSPGIVGFECTVLPQVERALIAGHDFVVLGERGQGKTSLLRSLSGLLDEWTPVIAGSEIGEHPYDPITAGRRGWSMNSAKNSRSAGGIAAPLHREAGDPEPRSPT